MDDIDIRLARQARNGDRRAFEKLVDLYQEKIYHMAYRLVGNVQEAEDVVQETFLRVFRNLPRYDEVYKFSTWIYRICTNLCIDRLRKRRQSFSLDAHMGGDKEEEEWYAVLPSDEVTPEKHMVRTELQEQIRRAIDALPAKYKAVVVLKYLHDFSLQEISEILHLPVSTVKTRVHRGREFLRKRLEKEMRRGSS